MTRSAPKRTGERTALILAAHGSLEDPLANAVVRGQAERVRALGLFDEVGVAFHRGEPSYQAALDGTRADRVTVVPLMTSSGYYSRVVLPRELRKSPRFPEIRLRVTDPVGTHPAMADIIERRASDLLGSLGLPRHDTSLAVVGHGTRRHRGSRKATEDLVERLGSRGTFAEVIGVFLDEEPGVERIPGLASQPRVIVVPFLIAGGLHALRDIPARVGLQGTDPQSPPFTGVVGERFIACDMPVGGDPGILDIILDLSLDRAPRLRSRPGRVFLVGAGPGDPDLITVKGLRLLRAADVVVHDRLVESDLIREVRPDAEVVDAGKRAGDGRGAQEQIHALLIDRARRGKLVVRLQGGDPFVFGRGWEEVAACLEAGVDCRVVPGVSSVNAVPAAAGIPLTLRGAARSFAVLTARSEDGDASSMEALERMAGADTLVILMGRARLREILDRLRAAGRDPETPAACIERGTTRLQRTARGTVSNLADIADALGLRSPVTIVIGDVAALAHLEEGTLEGLSAASDRAPEQEVSTSWTAPGA